MASRPRPSRLAWLVIALAASGLPLAASAGVATAPGVAPASGVAAGAAALVPLQAAAAGLAAPAIDAPATVLAAGTACRSMGQPLVYLICACVFLGSLAVMTGVFRALRRQGWSLANALSEPTRLKIPRQDGWSDSQGDRLAVAAEHGPLGTPTAVTLLEASSSRLIALIGSIAILLLYLGFGVFLLYSFGLSCSLPASTAAITNFLYSGLALFAPYVANKVAAVFRPGASPTTPAQVSPLPPAAAPLQAAPSRSAAETAHPAGSAPGSAPAPPPVTDPLAPAVALIAAFEGFVDHAYPDPASGGEPWTIGYGFTVLDGRPVRPGDRLDRARADVLLAQGVAACGAHLGGRIPHWGEMDAAMHCALISFAWNLGQDFYGDGDNFATITRVLRERDWAAVPEVLCLYINPGSSVSAGLLRRRRAEGTLWEQGLARLRAATASGTARSREPGNAAAASRVAAASATVPATGTPTTPASAKSSSAPSPAAAAPAHANPLPVPWFDQLNMDDGQGWRDCFSASSAMLAAYWGHSGDENAYNHLRQRYGDSTSAEAQLAALRHLGLQADFRTDGSEEDLRREIDAGRPVAVGWLHHGPASNPSGGGHWTVVIGYDATGVFMNDPYGNCDLVNGGYPSHHDGAGLHYSYRNWLPRWRPGGSGGWLLTCRP